ncbi:MAG: hypothetical protein IPK27_10580 [Rhodanobacteraceae bacterium]|nr:hypothetical protein [Rhodanobacteraceae bacterium]
MRAPAVAVGRGWWLAAAAMAALALLVWVSIPEDAVDAPGVGKPAGAEVSPVEAASPPTQAIAPASDAQPVPGWQILLLLDAGIAADPASVRIGLATISAEDMATHLAMRDTAGAAPVDAAEFAQVRRWLTLPATLQADGAVRVGPLTLEAADRYVLQAAGSDRLRQYHADFTADTAPVSLRPLLAAGLRVQRDAALEGEISLLLRRSGELPDAGRWQSLLQRSPALLQAFGEQPWALAAGANELAPLPPQALEALLLVDGIEAQQAPLTLVAGAWSELAIDPVAHAVARQLSVELTLRFVTRGSDAPVAGVQVAWQHALGQRTQASDDTGRVRFAGVDRQREQQFALQFPTGDAELPSWPQGQSLAFIVDEAHPDQLGERRIDHRVELDRLDWLLASSNSLPLDPERTAGSPYPVFVLQQRIDGLWIDSAAEYFRRVDAGLAVSLAAPGEYRVAAVMTPWTVLHSTSADARRPAPDGPHEVRLEAQPGRSVELRLSADGQPLPRTQVLAIGPLRGMPPFELVADLAGRVQLIGVTTDGLRIEVPGYQQTEVALSRPVVDVSLQRADAPGE